MVDSLEKLCLDNIGLNLYLNFMLCKKNSIKIPEEIGLKIYENSLTVNSYFSNKDVEIFNESMIHLKNVDLSKKQFKKISSLDFLNKQNLDKLNLANSKSINFYINNCYFTTKYLIIDFTFDDTKVKKRHLNFSHENLKCSEEIELISKLRIDTEMAFRMMKNSIRSIKLNNLTMNFKDFQLLCNVLRDKNNLQTLHLNLVSLSADYHEQITDDKLMDCFKNIPDTIEYFHLEHFTDELSFFEILSIFISKLKNLKSFSLDRLPCRNKLALPILEAITKFSSITLECLDLKMKTIDKKMNINLSKLVLKCHLLRKLQLRVDYPKNSSLENNFIESLADRIPKLEVFEIPFQGKILLENWKNFEIHLPKFQCLKKVILEDFYNEKTNLNLFREFLITIKKSLIELSFSNKFALEAIQIENFKWNFKNLNSISISNLKLDGNQKINIFKLFKDGDCGRLLTKVVISYSIFDENASINLRDFLLSCSQLQTIYLYEIESKPNDFGLVIDGLQSSVLSLTNIIIIECSLDQPETEKLSAILQKCRYIEKVSIFDYFGISCDVTYKLLEVLKLSRRTLETFQVYSHSGINKTHQDIRALTKYFKNLSEFSTV